MPTNDPWKQPAQLPANYAALIVPPGGLTPHHAATQLPSETLTPIPFVVDTTAAPSLASPPVIPSPLPTFDLAAASLASEPTSMNPCNCVFLGYGRLVDI